MKDRFYQSSLSLDNEGVREVDGFELHSGPEIEGIC